MPAHLQDTEAETTCGSEQSRVPKNSATLSMFIGMYYALNQILDRDNISQHHLMWCPILMRIQISLPLLSFQLMCFAESLSPFLGSLCSMPLSLIFISFTESLNPFLGSLCNTVLSVSLSLIFILFIDSLSPCLRSLCSILLGEVLSVPLKFFAASLHPFLGISMYPCVIHSRIMVLPNPLLLNQCDRPHLLSDSCLATALDSFLLGLGGPFITASLSLYELITCCLMLAPYATQPLNQW